MDWTPLLTAGAGIVTGFGGALLRARAQSRRDSMSESELYRAALEAHVGRLEAQIGQAFARIAKLESDLIPDLHA